MNDAAAVLRLSPRWLPATFWLLIAVLMISAVAVGWGRTSKYVAGMAVIVDEGRVDALCPADATVTEVLVRSGQRVRAQEPLAVLSLSASERVTVRAPSAGSVVRLRVRAGQVVKAGERLTSIAPEQARRSVVALFPPGALARLRPGMRVRLEIEGVPPGQRIEIEDVPAELVGPSEVRRYLGAEVAELVPMQGPVALVSAHVDAQGARPGMIGRAEVQLGSQPLWQSLLPSLGPLLGGHDG